MPLGAVTHGETFAHAELKRLALSWAQANGFAIGACEVRVPRSGYRADVAACARGRTRRTALFECKQARADLLKDVHDEAATQRRLAELIERRGKLEELLAVHRPDLRRGESLFPEYDAWDFSGLEHKAYGEVVAELATMQARRLRGTKFAKLLRWRAADYLYLVSEEGIFAEAEIPAGWGLLVRRAGDLELARRPFWTEPEAETRIALLESIALAATREVNRAVGVVLRIAPPGAADVADAEDKSDG